MPQGEDVARCQSDREGEAAQWKDHEPVSKTEEVWIEVEGAKL
jgi:hypothetical protein